MQALDYFSKPSTFGWNLTAAEAGGVNLYPLANAPLVQRLIDAGAIILGKTNIPTFSLDSWRTYPSTTPSWAGATLNAVNPKIVPGASSAGTATAVAAGFCVWGVAEETGAKLALVMQNVLFACKTHGRCVRQRRLARRDLCSLYEKDWKSVAVVLQRDG